MEELGKNLQDLEKILQGKQGNLSVIEDGKCALVAPVVLGHGERVGCKVADWEYL